METKYFEIEKEVKPYKDGTRRCIFFKVLFKRDSVEENWSTYLGDKFLGNYSSIPEAFKELHRKL